MSGAESSVPREPRTAKGKPDRKGILLSMTVLSERVIEVPGGNLSVSSSRSIFPSLAGRASFTATITN